MLLTLALVGGESSVSHPDRYDPEKSALRTHGIGGGVDPQPVWTLWTRSAPFASASNRTQVDYPVARHYTD
jgi:hypothetical protein